MSQIFHRSTNVISRLTIFGAVFFIGLLLWLMAQFTRSSYNTLSFVPREQPVQFSHKHHVSDCGIDCRYCHTTVETSAFAGIPSTKTCMNCHSQLWSNSPYLAPVRESFRTGEPIKWTKVHDLPDFVYFDHSIHVNKGVGCSTCHGRVDQMPLTWQVSSLQMEWCLECHRDPQKFIRPKKEVFTMDWPPDKWNQDTEGQKLLEENSIQSVGVLTSCSTCHR